MNAEQLSCRRRRDIKRKKCLSIDEGWQCDGDKIDGQRSCWNENRNNRESSSESGR